MTETSTSDRPEDMSCPHCRGAHDGGRQAPRYDEDRHQWMVYRGGWYPCEHCGGTGSVSPSLTTNAAECRTKLAPVYCRYPGQTEPQPAYIELDPQKRTLTADYSGEIGNAVPVPVWHGCILRLSITPYIHGEALADLLGDADLLTLAAEVCDGHSIEWVGSNTVGKLTADGQDALDDLTRLLDDIGIDNTRCVAVYSPGEWVQDDSQADIAADTTDERLAEIAAECIADTERERILIDGDMLAWLTELRGRLREAAQ